MWDQTPDNAWPDREVGGARERLRVIVGLILFLVVPMLLMGATTMATEGCGGG